jgi:hypothetical protein
MMSHTNQSRGDIWRSGLPQKAQSYVSASSCASVSLERMRIARRFDSESNASQSAFDKLNDVPMPRQDTTAATAGDLDALRRPAIATINDRDRRCDLRREWRFVVLHDLGEALDRIRPTLAR